MSSQSNASNVLQAVSSSLFQPGDALSDFQAVDTLTSDASTTASAVGSQFLSVDNSSFSSPQPFTSLDAPMMDPGSPLAASSDSVLGDSYVDGYLSNGVGGGDGFGYSPFDLFLDDDSNANAFMSALDSCVSKNLYVFHTLLFRGRTTAYIVFSSTEAWRIVFRTASTNLVSEDFVNFVAQEGALPSNFVQRDAISDVGKIWIFSAH